ncbi:MAG: DUF4405 domain-containing protein [Treponema sp.]|nr:DUF4405 domain-containing protein [Treponema sp.]
MTKQQLRMTLDVVMTAVSIVLMGGNYFFPWDGVHEILGASLFVLWIVHVLLNRRWYGELFKGAYSSYRVLQSIVNCALLVCVLSLMISGIMLSAHVFSFLHIDFGAEFARTLHLLGSHWYFVFMSLHIGMHMSLVFRIIQNARAVQSAKGTTTAWRMLLIAVCAYGVYAFIVRGIGKYLFLFQQFFFFDMERGYVLFFADYLAILVLLAAVSYYLAAALQKLHS